MWSWHGGLDLRSQVIAEEDLDVEDRCAKHIQVQLPWLESQGAEAHRPGCGAFSHGIEAGAEPVAATTPIMNGEIIDAICESGFACLDQQFFQLCCKFRSNVTEQRRCHGKEPHDINAPIRLIGPPTVILASMVRIR